MVYLYSRIWLYLGVLSLCGISVLGWGQQTAYTNAYQQNWQLVNPAAKSRWQSFTNGKHPTWLLSAGSRRQWVGSGWAGKILPTTSTVSVEWEPNKARSTDSEVLTKLGGVLLHDQTDALRHTAVMFNYARRLPLSADDAHSLYLGLNAGAIFRSLDASKLIAVDTDDAALFEAMGSRTNPEVALGLVYKNESGLYAGISLPQLVSMWLDERKEANLSTSAPTNRSPLSHFYFMAGGYLFPYDDEELLVIEPSAWVRATRGVSYLTFSDTQRFPLSVDVNCRALWNRTFGAGLGYSSLQQASLEFSFLKVIQKGLNQQAENRDYLRIGLQYAFPVGWNAPPMGHSFEVQLSYGFWGF